MWIDRLGALKRLAVWMWGHLPIPLRLRGVLQWLLNPKFIIGTVCVVFDDAGRVLLVKHTYKARPWGLPGGGMSPGETTEEAALRELREEAGVAGTIERLIGIRTHRARRLIDVFFLCRGEVLDFKPSAEISERAWFPVEALPPGTSAHLQSLLRHVRAQQSGHLPDVPMTMQPVETAEYS